LGLEELLVEGVRPRLIFLDPPYGDNVPYLEFSTIWNSILREKVRFDSEVVVSDRTEERSNWEDYRDRLCEVTSRCAVLLQGSGHLVVTFNNLERKAWFAILSSLQTSGFACTRSWYQVPAVVSTKAQLASEGSYIGDFYCIYVVDPSKIRSSTGDAEASVIRSAVLRTLLARNGSAPKVVVMRTILDELLKNNFPADAVIKVEDFLDEIVTQENGSYRLKKGIENLGGQFDSIPKLPELVERTALRKLRNTDCGWKELYAAIAEATETIGIPSQAEVREILADKIMVKGKKCSLREEIRQPRLI